MDDDVTLTALRLLVKDLLLLFEAVNEGVINVLGTTVPWKLSGSLSQSHKFGRALL
jgi:ANTH domain